MKEVRHLAFPFRIGPNGRTATPETLEDHVKGEVAQLLLTDPGERAFLPSFGGGLRRLLFERNDEAAAGVAKAVITQALSRWLGHRVTVERLEVQPEAEPGEFRVELSYTVVANGAAGTVGFVHKGD